MALLLCNCRLLQNLGLDALSGSAQTFGEDANYPDVIHFYKSSNPHVSDPYRLFIIEKFYFKYKEAT